MLYALKKNNKVIAVAENQLDVSWEEIDLKDKELLIFFKRNPEVIEKLIESTDIDFIRVVEDVIDVLIKKTVIQFTDLPAPVQNKLLNRRSLREEIRANSDTTQLLNSENTMF